MSTLVLCVWGGVVFGLDRWFLDLQRQLENVDTSVGVFQHLFIYLLHQ